MNRLGIFVFYDKEGVADEYVYFLLDSMKEVTSRLIIVVNGIICSDSIKRFCTYAEKVLIRKNSGYDGGAYKEVILSLSENNELDEIDELILFNDTFYGPFFSWNIIFRKMEEKDVDFWGLSKWIKDSSKIFENELQDHLQSYFLVIKKRMLQSVPFKKFWQNLENIYTYQDAVYHFEVMFTVYHSMHGFQYASWLDGKETYLGNGEVVYGARPFELIKNCSFPILKIKSVTVTNFLQAGAALQYIEDYYEYDIKMVWNHIDRMEASGTRGEFSFKEIERFISLHQKIYIYGYGKWGHAIESLFHYKGWKIACIIDSDKKKQSQFVKKLEDIRIETEDGIIIALGKEAFQTVYPLLDRIFDRPQMLLPKRSNKYEIE